MPPHHRRRCFRCNRQGDHNNEIRVTQLHHASTGRVVAYLVCEFCGHQWSSEADDEQAFDDLKGFRTAKRTRYQI